MCFQGSAVSDTVSTPDFKAGAIWYYMTLRYVCRICGEVLEADTEENVVELAQHHFRNQHGMDDSIDTDQPNLLENRDEIRKNVEEVDQE